MFSVHKNGRGKYKRNIYGDEIETRLILNVEIYKINYCGLN